MNNDFFCWALIVFYIKLDHPVVLMWLKTSPHTLPISVLIFSLASLMFLQVLTSSFFSVVLPSPGWSHKSLKENNLTAHLSPRRTPGFSTWSSLFSLNDFQLYISTKSSMTTTHSILTKCLPKSWVQANENWNLTNLTRSLFVPFIPLTSSNLAQGLFISPFKKHPSLMTTSRLHFYTSILYRRLHPSIRLKGKAGYIYIFLTVNKFYTKTKINSTWVHLLEL